MREYAIRTSIPATVEQVFLWHQGPDALRKLTPRWMPVSVVRTDDGLVDGNEVVLRLGTSFAGMNWVARISNVRQNAGFEDNQVSGPFKYWHHTHNFIASADGRTILEDKVEYSLPFGMDNVVGWLVDMQLELLFRHRHAVTRAAFAQ